MSDFEKLWQQKLKENFIKICTSRTLELLENSDLAEPNFSTVILKQLKKDIGEEKAAQAMMSCSCEYPEEDLKDIKAEYERTGSLKIAHQMLQKKFDYFLREVLKLEEDLLAEIKVRNWGAAGKLEGNTIIAAKIPKSGYIKEYFKATDPETRKKLYCHCPHIRPYIGKEDIDPIYCYCGAGFYKNIWEYITGKKVDVKLNKSILKDDYHCQFILKVSQ